jgi:hypothetical protein
MKTSQKKLLLSMVIAMTSVLASHAQKGTGAAVSPDAPANKWSSWSAWASNDCYKGLLFRVKTLTLDTGLKELSVEFQNSYEEKVSFNCTVRGGRTNGGNRFSIQGNSTKIWWAGYQNSETIYIDFERIRLGDDTGAYMNCDK